MDVMDPMEAIWSYLNSLTIGNGLLTLGTVLGFAITNIVTFLGIRWTASEERRNAVSTERRARLNDELREFYLPLLSYIGINRKLIESVGHASFPQASSLTDKRELAKANALRQEAATVWNTIRDEVVLPFNEKMREIIETKSSYMHVSDDPRMYINLAVHLTLYKQFNKKSFEAYTQFQFPKEIEEHVRKIIGLIRKEIAAHAS